MGKQAVDERTAAEQQPGSPHVAAPHEAPTSYYDSWQEWQPDDPDDDAVVSLFALVFSLVVWVVMGAVWLFVVWYMLHAGSMGG